MEPGAREPRAQRRGGLRSRVGALLALLAALVGLSVWLPAFEPGASRGKALASVPNRIEGWRAEVLPVDRDFFGSVRFTERLHRRYRREGEALDLFVGLDDRTRRHRSVLSDKTALPGPGWVVDRRETLELGDLKLRVLEIRSTGRTSLVYHWYEDVGPVPQELLRALLALDASPFRRPGRGAVVRLSTELPLAAGGRARADARLRSFAESVRKALAEVLGRPEEGSQPATGRPTAGSSARRQVPGDLLENATQRPPLRRWSEGQENGKTQARLAYNDAHNDPSDAAGRGVPVSGSGGFRRISVQ